ncbi:MAG: hypothetical protein NZ580_03090 [Bacteroidia bacterium]|nr:hypothetical protein [Bacteroidia bacterium]MDW8235317.1 hypothetical protein [Bacteroidia bacterium]
MLGSLFIWAQTWENVAGGTDGDVYALFVWQGALYVGGSFRNVGGTALRTQGIARYTPRGGWQKAHVEIGLGGRGIVYAISEYRGKLVIGGDFTSVDGIPARHLAMYDPLSGRWSEIGGGTDGPVYAIAVCGNDLWVGGRFLQVGDPPQPIAALAYWDRGAWRAPVPAHSSTLLVGGNVYALACIGDSVYIGGAFTETEGGQSAYSYLALLRKSQARLIPPYTPYEVPPSAPVRTLSAAGRNLWVGGEFAGTGSALGRVFLLSEGRTITLTGAPTGGAVQAILPTSGTTAYIAGTFLSAAGKPVARIAYFSPRSTWEAVGEGLGPFCVYAITLYEGKLYAGGDFLYTASGTEAPRIAALSLATALTSSERTALVREVRWLDLTGRELLKQRLSEPVSPSELVHPPHQAPIIVQGLTVEGTPFAYLVP